jgi:hypothetical protein
MHPSSCLELFCGTFSLRRSLVPDACTAVGGVHIAMHTDRSHMMGNSQLGASNPPRTVRVQE